MQRSPLRAFTLIEVIIALTMGAVLMAGVLYLFNQTRYTAVEASTRAQMARDAQLVLDMLGRDLAHAGAGVPAGTCGDGTCTADSSLRPAIRRALARNLVVVGDQPFPNAEVAGVVAITRFLGDADSPTLAVESELSGSCTPPTSTASLVFACETSTATFVPDMVVTTSDDCKTGNEGARTCPWGMNKWKTADGQTTSLIATDASGNFYSRRWTAGTFADVDGRYRGITLDAGLTRASFFGSVGGSHLANLDRVFWSVENEDGSECSGTSGDCVVRRRQCWGPISNPTASGFPSAGTGRFGSASAPDDCTAPADGTGWETLVDGVKDLTIRYVGTDPAAPFTAPVPTANLDDIRAIDVEIVLERQTPGSGPKLTHRVRQRIFLENRDSL